MIGLLCAALGKPRVERVNERSPSLSELAALRMGVRTDRQGRLEVDYQTAGGTHRLGEQYGVVRASGGRGETVQSRRYYLAGASFLVGLESADDGLLRRLENAIRRPVWQLSLGRKAFVPGEPVWLPDAPPGGPYWSLGLAGALVTYPWRAQTREPAPEVLHCVLDAPSESESRELRYDVPIDFATRRFGPRYVTREDIRTPEVADVRFGP